MAQENWSHTSISIYKVECSVYKYTEYYRQAKIHPLYSILSKKSEFRFTFFIHTFVCRYNIISYLDHLLKLLYLLCFNPLFLEKTLCRIYPLLYSYFVSNLFSISDNFSLSPSSNVGHFSLQTV